MRTAGIRELRDHLSRYLALVQGGEELTVTDRGRAVARLIPVDQDRPFDRLVAQGAIELAPTAERSRPGNRVAATAPVSDLVAEQRR